MITERQKKLAEWFGDWEIDNEILLGASKDVDIAGQWLDADWVGRFIKAIASETQKISFNVDWNLRVKVSTGVTGKKWVEFNEGSLTERLQEATKQAIEWLPKESKMAIKLLRN